MLMYVKKGGGKPYRKILKDKTDVTYDKFSEFIHAVSDDFKPAFLSYVNLRVYFEKIKKLADFIYCVDNDNIVGLVVIYCNDEDLKESYIPFVAVRREYRKCHIAKSLMTEVENHALEKGMRSIKIRTNNSIALTLYQKLKYEIYDIKYEEDLSLERYYLKKQLSKK